MLYLKDNDIQADGSWCVAYISDGSGKQDLCNRVEGLIQSGIVRRLVELMLHPLEKVHRPALRAVANICAGTELQAQVVINAGGLPCITRLILTSSSKVVVKEACWTLSNILAGNKDQIQTAIEVHCLTM